MRLPFTLLKSKANMDNMPPIKYVYISFIRMEEFEKHLAKYFEYCEIFRMKNASNH